MERERKDKPKLRGKIVNKLKELFFSSFCWRRKGMRELSGLMEQGN
jgi:hypothetical protein